MNLSKDAHSISALVSMGFISDEAQPQLAKVEHNYPIAITSTMLAAMDKNNKNDPISKQFLPTIDELINTADEHEDPIGDFSHSPIKGIVHRYPDRVLFKLVHLCPVYCRFCFRREMVGPEGNGTLTSNEIDAALNYIAAHKDIWEVIFTGGDPLILSSRRLHDIMIALDKIPHVKILRIHTRIPLVDPTRINDALIKALTASNKTIFIAIHANHKNEFTPEGIAAITHLHHAHITLISQTVLLRGINDNVITLTELMRCFVEHHVKPYYIHHPDKAKGTAHFRLPLERGYELINALRGHISGLCQPHYMLDIPRGYGKVAIKNATRLPAPSQGYEVIDYQGRSHIYTDE